MGSIWDTEFIIELEGEPPTMVCKDDYYQAIKQLFPNQPIRCSTLCNIYVSAKQNHACQLVATMNKLPDPKLRDYLLNLRFDDQEGQSLTPLTMASMTGNIMYVKTLLSQYNIDLERESNVVFDGLLVYGVTALWVAAAMDHLQIVKLLIQHGANVNHNTKAQSSPLRAACYSGCLDIVKYLIEHGADVNLSNKYNNTCLMIAAYKGHTHVVETLLKNNATPNNQALCGATALHYCAERGHLDVCHLLLEYGARLLVNEHGLTPVLCAAERTHESLVEYFITRPNLITKEEIVTTLELLGASFANSKEKYSIEKSYTYLLRAMELRYSEPDCIIRKHIQAPIAAYDEWFETQNLNDLRAIRLNHHSIHMEGLTIRERILGKTHPDLPEAIVYRGAVMADHGRYMQCVTLWNYAMDLCIATNVSIENDLLRFARLFAQIYNTDPDCLDMGLVLSILVKCQQEIERNKEKIVNPGHKYIPLMIADQIEQNILTALYLIRIMTKNGPKRAEISKDHVVLLYTTVKKLLLNDIRLKNGQTLLHMAVNGKTYVDDFQTNDVVKFPCYSTAVLLVHLGANVNAMDVERNTPLHTFIGKCPGTYPQSFAERIVKLLIDAGAHLDAVNCRGLTPVHIGLKGPLGHYLRKYHNNLISLKCLASRCIVYNNVPYKGVVPTILEPYIQMHSPEKF